MADTENAPPANFASPSDSKLKKASGIPRLGFKSPNVIAESASIPVKVTPPSSKPDVAAQKPAGLRPAAIAGTARAQSSAMMRATVVNPAKHKASSPVRKPVIKSVIVDKKKPVTGVKPLAFDPPVDAPTPAPVAAPVVPDYSERFQQLEQLMSQMQSQLTEKTSTTHQLEATCQEKTQAVRHMEAMQAELQAQLQIKTTELLSKSAQAQHLERQLTELQIQNAAQIAQLRAEHTSAITVLTSQRDDLLRRLEAVQADLSTTQQSFKSTVQQMSNTAFETEARLRATQSALDGSQTTCSSQSVLIAQLQASLLQKTQDLAACEEKLRHDEMVRRQLHNTIQELKGNIRVFCRVRPLLGAEVSNAEANLLEFGDAEQRRITLTNTADHFSGKAVEKKFEFQFDRVFEPTESQAQVFEEISQLVQSALDGYNVCIFAYGQTGSGKTFTMEGPEHDCDNPELAGMIPRAVSQIFASAEQLKEKGWTYELSSSFLEIYNETVRDLLGDGSEASQKLEIRTSRDGNGVDVTDAVVARVDSEQAVMKLIARAQKNRAVGETQCNTRSSRSHSVFRLRLSGINKLTGNSCQGVLNLIDLAGSERLASSGSTGDRLKETQSINKSLSNLGTVIMALANKESHIPYRNSKLTYLLQDSLGGNSKTLMFVNINPRADSASETLCSLRFATKVNACNIGTAQQKVKI